MLKAGKRVINKIYMHRNYADGHPFFKSLQFRPPEDFDYTVIRVDESNGSVAFIQCEDFDTAHEPTVGDMHIIYPDGQTRFYKKQNDPWIYHKKWLMVDDDYEGFDIEESKLRSKEWESIRGIDKKKIGRKSYWEQNVLPLLEEERCPA